MLPVQSHAAVKVIADTGQPAPDFPEGFIYRSIGNPSIGASGHIAFPGMATTSLGSTENHTNAVWAGLPGQLRTIVRENDTVSGFPPNVLFSSFDYGMQLLGKLVVTPSGAVGFPAMMKDAGQLSFHKALLAHVNGKTIGILRELDPAPGFPAGTFVSDIESGLPGFAFSDAGMVILGRTTSNETGIWLHDFNTITRLPCPVADCRVMFSPTVSINQEGVVVLFGGFISNNDPSKFLIDTFKWHNGQWQTVITQDSLLPGGAKAVLGMTQAILTFQNRSPPLPQSMVDDQGNVAFFASLINPSSVTQNKGSLWYKTEAAEPRLIALAEETLPGDPNAVIANLTFPFLASSVSNNGATVVPVALTTGETALLSGLPRTSQPYASLQETGEIQLSVIARQNRRPPGFGETWFYSDFLGQVLNRNGDFIFHARSQDAVSPNTSMVDAIWRGRIGGQPRLKAMTGMKINVNGQERILRGIFAARDAQINTNGTPSQFSDTGDFVFAGDVDGGLRSILLMIPDDHREQRIFALAEQLYPQFFAPANAEDRLLEGFEYRFYSGTNTYIGIKDDNVFVLGAPNWPEIKHIGTIDETLSMLERMTQ